MPWIIPFLYFYVLINKSADTLVSLTSLELQQLAINMPYQR